MYIVITANLYESFDNFEAAHTRYRELCHSGKYSVVEMKRVSCN